MACSYTSALEAAMLRAFSSNPEIASGTARTLAKLQNGGYEQGLVDAIFQKWERFPLTMSDAFGFTQVYSDLMLGRVRLARISVGHGPLNDEAVEGNNNILGNLQPQFSAEFWGGLTDHDGVFRWHDHLHLGGYINVDGNLVDGPEITIDAGKAALEVGYQSVGKTLNMVRSQGTIARWPYGSEEIWVLCQSSSHNRFARNTQTIQSACVRDADGWPCARTRIAV